MNSFNIYDVDMEYVLRWLFMTFILYVYVCCHAVWTLINSNIQNLLLITWCKQFHTGEQSSSSQWIIQLASHSLLIFFFSDFHLGILKFNSMWGCRWWFICVINLISCFARWSIKMNVLLSSLKYRCVASKVTIQLLYVEIEPGYLAFGRRYKMWVLRSRPRHPRKKRKEKKNTVSGSSSISLQ